MTTLRFGTLVLLGFYAAAIMNVFIVPIYDVLGLPLTNYERLFSDMFPFEVSYAGSWVIFSILAGLFTAIIVKVLLRIEELPMIVQGTLLGFSMFILVHTLVIPQMLGSDDLVSRSHLITSIGRYLLFGIFVSKLAELQLKGSHA